MLDCQRNVRHLRQPIKSMKRINWLIRQQEQDSRCFTLLLCWVKKRKTVKTDISNELEILIIVAIKGDEMKSDWKKAAYLRFYHVISWAFYNQQPCHLITDQIISKRILPEELKGLRKISHQNFTKLWHSAGKYFKN